MLEKGLSADDMKLAVEKYLHVRKERKTESRASEAQHADRAKAALTDEIRNAKKKLERL